MKSDIFQRIWLFAIIERLGSVSIQKKIFLDLRLDKTFSGIGERKYFIKVFHRKINFFNSPIAGVPKKKNIFCGFSIGSRPFLDFLNVKILSKLVCRG